MFEASFWQQHATSWVDRFLTPLDDPGSRLFYLNLFAAAALALVYLVRGAHKPTSLRNTLGLRKKYWWNRSTRTDYGLYLLNSVLKVFIFIPFLDLGFRVSQATVNSLLALNGDFLNFKPTFGLLLAFTFGSFVFDDFLRFFHHWMMHKVPWLWRFHVAHHSARVLTPMTLYRTHPVETAMAAIRNSISLGVATGLFLFLFRGHFHVLTFFGVNAFGQIFNFLGATLRHSQLPLGFGPLERLFISPAQHQIHHSRDTRDFDRNFGVSLAIWDHLFGSLVLSRDRQEVFSSRGMRFGVSGAPAFGLASVLLRPFLRSHLSFNGVSGALQRGNQLDAPVEREQNLALKTEQVSQA